MGKYKVVKPFIDQDTKRRFEPGQTYMPLSDFEKSRNTAEGNVVPVDDTVIERAVQEPTEIRKRKPRRKKIIEPETNHTGNG